MKKDAIYFYKLIYRSSWPLQTSQRSPIETNKGAWQGYGTLRLPSPLSGLYIRATTSSSRCQGFFDKKPESLDIKLFRSHCFFQFCVTFRRVCATLNFVCISFPAHKRRANFGALGSSKSAPYSSHPSNFLRVFTKHSYSHSFNTFGVGSQILPLRSFVVGISVDIPSLSWRPFQLESLIYLDEVLFCLLFLFITPLAIPSWRRSINPLFTPSSILPLFDLNCPVLLFEHAVVHGNQLTTSIIYLWTIATITTSSLGISANE